MLDKEIIMKRIIKGLIASVIFALATPSFSGEMIRYDKEFFPNYYGPYAKSEFSNRQGQKQPNYYYSNKQRKGKKIKYSKRNHPANREGMGDH